MEKLEEIFIKLLEEVRRIQKMIRESGRAFHQWDYHSDAFKRDSGLSYLDWLKTKGDQGWELCSTSGLNHIFKRKRIK